MPQTDGAALIRSGHLEIRADDGKIRITPWGKPASIIEGPLSIALEDGELIVRLGAGSRAQQERDLDDLH